MWDVKSAVTPIDKPPKPAPETYEVQEFLRLRYQRAVGYLMYCMLGA